MTMHLMKIRVTEKSTSTKWKSAEHKRKAEQLQAEWEALMKKHESPKITKTKANTHASSTASKNSNNSIGFTPPRGSNYKSIPSLPDSGGNATLKTSNVYTGDKVLGISIVHKSCLQPVFTEEQAKDLANMRR